ncbi:cAMP-independent regulatory protein pac2 [Smittium culicis]|uniref:cAMP-independent regulatory protein pac2 n=1 Tax=Smittium culicis TaxID=133412 RepID=A0A1R1YH82_9FUNG|nr:cAMP-independent regulatory protein pac2 [Smittium culicis]
METYHGYIETTNDCLIIFEACRLGLLKCVQRRLSDDERVQITSGSIFVWDEEESGIKRWTDGKCWSPSRVNGCFLSYHELENKKSLNIKEFSGSIEPSPSSPISLNNTCSSESFNDQWDESQDSSDSSKKTGLIKKALSVFTSFGNKLHLICYYKKEDVSKSKLSSPSADPRLKNITIPRGMYPEMVPELIHPIVGYVPSNFADPTPNINQVSQDINKKSDRLASSVTQISSDYQLKYVPYHYPKDENLSINKGLWESRQTNKRKHLDTFKTDNSSNYELVSSRDSRFKRAYSGSYELPSINKDNNSRPLANSRPRLQTLAAIAIDDSLNPTIYSAPLRYNIVGDEAPKKDFRSDDFLQYSKSNGRSNSLSVMNNAPILDQSKKAPSSGELPNHIFNYKNSRPIKYFQSREDKRQLAALRSTMFKI